MTPLSYQLYSSRNFGPLEATLSMLSEIGYSQVEGFGALLSSVEEAEKISNALKATGLEMTSSHIGMEDLEKRPDECVAMAKQLGLKAAYVPFLMPDQRPSDEAGWKAIGARAEAAMAPLIAEGLDVGWHNHEFELADMDSGGTAFDALLAGGPSLKLELDLAWVVIGEKNPIAFMEKHADRMSSVHIKDIAPKGACADEDGWADVGHGTIDWEAIRDAVAKTTTKFLIVEHDNPKDDARFARRSFETVQKVWGA
jgi:sugar phosphate isomerase/epimerase